MRDPFRVGIVNNINPGATLMLAPDYFVLPFQGEEKPTRRFKQISVIGIEENPTYCGLLILTLAQARLYTRALSRRQSYNELRSAWSEQARMSKRAMG
jgi:hypothetical protein